MKIGIPSIHIRHNFETAHRLPVLPGKCQNIHGHSWWADIVIEGDLDDNGVIVEFGQVKKIVRDWIDKNLDHGAMLGWEDPLRDAFLLDGTKVFWFRRGADDKAQLFPGTDSHPWPTVEAVAQVIGETVGLLIAQHFPNPRFGVTGVSIRETHVNGAGFEV